MEYYIDIDKKYPWSIGSKILAGASNKVYVMLNPIDTPTGCLMITVTLSDPEIMEDLDVQEKNIHGHLISLKFSRVSDKRNIVFTNYVNGERYVFTWDYMTPCNPHSDNHWINLIGDMIIHMFKDFDDIGQCVEICRFRVTKSLIDQAEIIGWDISD